MALIEPSKDDKLGLIPTADLLVELLSRYDHAVFSGIQDRPVSPDKKDGVRVTSRRYVGDPYTCIGAAHQAIDLCQYMINHVTQELSPDDL